MHMKHNPTKKHRQAPKNKTVPITHPNNHKKIRQTITQKDYTKNHTKNHTKKSHKKHQQGKKKGSILPTSSLMSSSSSSGPTTMMGVPATAFSMPVAHSLTPIAPEIALWCMYSLFTCTNTTTTYKWFYMLFITVICAHNIYPVRYPVNNIYDRCMIFVLRKMYPSIEPSVGRTTERNRLSFWTRTSYRHPGGMEWYCVVLYCISSLCALIDN